MSALRIAWLLVAVSLVLGGCRDRSEITRIGIKDFTEQRVVAHMMGELLKRSGQEVAMVPCGDTAGCQAKLRTGEIDMMVDYTGTGLQFVGAPKPDKAAPLAQLTELYKPLGLTWSMDLGFDNGYLVVVPTALAVKNGWKRLSDVAAAGPVSVALPDEYRRRPGDGLGALLSRYGITMAGQPLVINEPAERYGALLSGRADVGIAYSTDGALIGLGLTALIDDLDFFPPYRAALVVRTDRADTIGKTLMPLKGKLDNDTVARLNRAVDVAGRSARDVGIGALAELSLIADPGADTQKTGLVVAAFEDVTQADLVSRAMKATRSVFAGLTVELKPSDDPITSVAKGSARLALMGAERFFSDGADPEVDRRLEAAAVVGHRFVHVIRRASDATGGFEGALGIPNKSEASRRIAIAASASPAVVGTLEELLGKLSASAVDAVVVLAPKGDATLVTALAGGNLALASLPNFLSAERARALPWLRAARLAAGTYGSLAAVDTFSVQVVLAGPSRSSRVVPVGGPISSETFAGRPLTATKVRALADATGILEAPNPALPSAWSPAPIDASNSDKTEWFDTLLNIFAVVFMIWLARLITQPASARQEPEVGSA
jgi:osmoprotectant transport system substrate-binding protein